MRHAVRQSNAQKLAEEVSAPKPAPARKAKSPAELKATEAASFADVLIFNLLAMSSDFATPQTKLEACERAMTVWPALCRRMAELEALCPNSAAAGYEQAERLREVVEGASA